MKGFAEQSAGRKDRDKGSPGHLSISNMWPGSIGCCHQMTNGKFLLALPTFAADSSSSTERDADGPSLGQAPPSSGGDGGVGGRHYGL